MSAFFHLMHTLREKGLAQTTLIVISHFRDLTFDFKYKTDTMGWRELSTLDVLGPNREHGVQYQPTQARALREVLDGAGLPREGTFLDLGCGKGRTMILMAEFGYRRIIGVEFAELLCDVARQNLAGYRRRFSSQAEFQVVHADAAEYPIPAEVRAIYLCNPFDEVVMAKVVRNIETSLRKSPRQLHLIYGHPLQRGLIEANGLFREVARYSFPQCDYVVFRSSLPS